LDEIPLEAASPQGVTKLCRPGDVTYVVISATSNVSFWRSALVDWKVNRSDTMSDRFARRPLVLLHDGQWYVDATLSE
jgi:hypothetical protein